MGAKYLPTIKDRNASLRFRRIQAAMLQAKKAAAAKPTKKVPKP